MTVYALLPDRYMFPGVARVFKEGERLKLWEVVYAEDHQSAEMGEGASVIFGAWHDSYAMPIRRWKCRKILLWTSPIAQVEFDEMPFVEHIRGLLERGHLEAVWCGSQDMVEVFGKKAFYAPYPLTLPKVPDPRPATLEGHASLFCPSHPRKNIAVQLLAAKRAGLTVHLNGQAHMYGPLITALGLPFIEHHWMLDESYWRTVASMDIGLQASHAGVESFNYVTWDHLCMEVPVVTSLCWAHGVMDMHWHDCDPYTLVAFEDEIRKLRVGADFRPKGFRSRCENFADHQNGLLRAELEKRGLIG